MAEQGATNVQEHLDLCHLPQEIENHWFLPKMKNGLLPKFSNVNGQSFQLEQKLILFDSFQSFTNCIPDSNL